MLRLETRVTNFIQGGYDVGFLYYPGRSRWGFGLSVAGQNISGSAKELVFTGENLDPAEIRLRWLLGVQTRYHFSSGLNGFFGEVSAGLEEFRVTYGEESQADRNGFITPAVGYLWHPWKEKGFYIMPKVATPLTFARAEEQTIRDVTYRLRAIFPSPSLSLGWKFWHSPYILPFSLARRRPENCQRRWG